MDGDIDEEAVTIESLQAQIDMSMSFAQSLVSSWVKPSTKSSNSRSRVLESELLEIARRRPRLGVGAETLEVRTLPRDTARLKGQLVGKKRARDQADIGSSQNQVDSEGEEESRAGAIKKKSKVDPFATSRKKDTSLHPTSTQSGPPVSQASSGKTQLVGTDDARSNVPTNVSSPKTKVSSKRANANVTEEDTSDSPLSPPSSTSIRGKGAPDKPSNRLSSSAKFLELTGKENDKLDILSTTSSSVANNEPPAPSSPASAFKLPLVSLAKAKDAPSPTKLHSELRDQPILNLEAISSDSDSEEDPTKRTHSTVSKKKRRRRKKKKKNPVDPSPVSPEPVQSPKIKLLIT